MKKSTIITALAAILMMAAAPAFAQEDNGFKKFNVREDFTENGFHWFHDAELLAAGDKLGAETVSVQSMNVRQIENSQGRTGRTSLATISMQILPIAISIARPLVALTL